MIETVEENQRYYNKKRFEALEMIKPYCEFFKIDNYDYKLVLNEDGFVVGEWLCLEDTKIGCACNSLEATRDELLTYIYLTRCRKYMGVFAIQTKNKLKEYWRPRNV